MHDAEHDQVFIKFVTPRVLQIIAQQTSVFLETMGITRYLLQSKPDILFIESMFEFQIWHS